jgi:hypothetical protein
MKHHHHQPLDEILKINTCRSELISKIPTKQTTSQVCKCISATLKPTLATALLPSAKNSKPCHIWVLHCRLWHHPLHHILLMIVRSGCCTSCHCWLPGLDHSTSSSASCLPVPHLQFVTEAREVRAVHVE